MCFDDLLMCAYCTTYTILTTLSRLWWHTSAMMMAGTEDRKCEEICIVILNFEITPTVWNLYTVLNMCMYTYIHRTVNLIGEWSFLGSYGEGSWRRKQMWLRDIPQCSVSWISAWIMPPLTHFSLTNFLTAISISVYSRDNK